MERRHSAVTPLRPRLPRGCLAALPRWRSRLSPWRVVLLVLLLSVSCARGPTYFTLLPITAVMKDCGQLSCDGHPIASQPRAEPSLSPPLGGSSAVNIHHVNN